MSLATSLLELQRRTRRVEYAMQAVDNVHGGYGNGCPEDDYCERCREKIMAAVDRFFELPKFLRIATYICAPIASFQMMRELKYVKAEIRAHDYDD